MNRLAHASSPYLLQHANNPVDWFEWGDKAFASARERDLPLMISIGYAACHWCHAMAHETFENAELAELTNRVCVAIKIDREERPDIDAIYTEAMLATRGSSGWPLTVFATPDGKPFYVGTYFPPTSRDGMPGFGDVLHAIADAWNNEREAVEAHAASLTTALEVRLAADTVDVKAGETDTNEFHQIAACTYASGCMPAVDVRAHAATAMLQYVDHEWGGFGNAPKFPTPMSLLVLLTNTDPATEAETRAAALHTLDAIAAGGIYDHLGGGFHRYATDTFWMVPHFEKMLADQALITRVYLTAFQLTGNGTYRQVAEETLDAVLRDFSCEDGGFLTSLDADANGIEGEYYVWSKAEIRSALVDFSDEDVEEFFAWYGVTDSGNFEGRNILHRTQLQALKRRDHLERARKQLLAYRTQRMSIARDIKRVLEWNAYLVGTLADAARVLNRDDYLEAAKTCMRFCQTTLFDNKVGWLRVPNYRSDTLPIAAFAIDHAALLDAFLRLSEATGETEWLESGCRLGDLFIDLFLDGSVVRTQSRKHTGSLVRAVDRFDGATPSANSLALFALARLGRITNDPRYRDAARALDVVPHQHITAHPLAYATYVLGLQHL